MHIQHLISIGLVTMVTVATIYFWIDRLKGTNPAIQEAFIDMNLAKLQWLIMC